MEPLGKNPKRKTTDMLNFHRALLERFAKKYIWWKTPAEAIATPERIIAQVMNMGEFEDMQLLAEELGYDCLRHVISVAEAGWFNERSWAYWHYRLNLTDLEQVPPLPVRKFT